MATSRALTGGTGDVNPQYMTAIFTKGTGTIGDVKEVTMPLPVNRVTTGRASTAQVVEVLKFAVDFDWLTSNGNIATGDGPNVNVRYFAEVDQRSSTTIVGQTRPSCIFSKESAVYLHAIIAAVTSSQINLSGGMVDVGPLFIDLTDGAGHGILVAADQLFFRFSVMQANVTGTTYPAATIRMFYRLKNVSLQEYVGMVATLSA